jgi:hypothetical protein
MYSTTNHRLPITLDTLMLAGLAGGIAEVAWVALYCTFVPLDSAEVLRQIVVTASPTLAASPTAPAIGMLMHMGLAVALAIGYGHFMRGAIPQRSSLAASILSGAVALATVWAINFFVLLPILNPAFVILMPYSVSLVSKLLFGASMGWVLFACRENFVVGDPAQHATHHRSAH